MSSTTSYVTERASEKIANYGAAAAVSSPWWLPSIHDISSWCADWLPIMGLIWLLVQIGFKLYDRWKHHYNKDEE